MLSMNSYYHIFRESVRSGNHGRTAQFFLQYMDRVWNVLKLDEAVRVRAKAKGPFFNDVSFFQLIC